MELLFRTFAANVALILELLVILSIVAGSTETLWQFAKHLWQPTTWVGARRQLWVGYARWLVLALEFALAADIVRTAIAPTWTDIGQLAAIAAIRTALGLFLERDIEAFAPMRNADS